MLWEKGRWDHSADMGVEIIGEGDQFFRELSFQWEIPRPHPMDLPLLSSVSDLDWPDTLDFFSSLDPSRRLVDASFHPTKESHLGMLFFSE